MKLQFVFENQFHLTWLVDLFFTNVYLFKTHCFTMTITFYISACKKKKRHTKKPTKPCACINPSFLNKFCIYSEHKVVGAKIKLLDNLKYFTEQCFRWVFLLPALNSPCAEGCEDVAGYCPWRENIEPKAE